MERYREEQTGDLFLQFTISIFFKWCSMSGATREWSTQLMVWRARQAVAQLDWSASLWTKMQVDKNWIVSSDSAPSSTDFHSDTCFLIHYCIRHNYLHSLTTITNPKYSNKPACLHSTNVAFESHAQAHVNTLQPLNSLTDPMAEGDKRP